MINAQFSVPCYKKVLLVQARIESKIRVEYGTFYHSSLLLCLFLFF